MKYEIVETGEGQADGSIKRTYTVSREAPCRNLEVLYRVKTRYEFFSTPVAAFPAKFDSFHHAKRAAEETLTREHHMDLAKKKDYSKKHSMEYDPETTTLEEVTYDV